jgi:hypothetical protein
MKTFEHNYDVSLLRPYYTLPHVTTLVHLRTVRFSLARRLYIFTLAKNDISFQVYSSDPKPTLRTWTIPKVFLTLIQRDFHVRAKTWQPAHQNFDAVTQISHTPESRITCTDLLKDVLRR